MKRILFFIMMLPVVVNGQELSKVQKQQLRDSGIYYYFKLPSNEAKNKITYSKQRYVPNVLKNKLYKRALEFIALKEWDAACNIICKDKTPTTQQLVSKPIAYTDSEDGIISGSGYFFYPLPRANQFYITFKYRIVVSDLNYSYTLSDFIVNEFMRGEISKSRGSSTAISNTAFGSSKTRFYGVDVREWAMEDFLGNRILNDGYHERFQGFAGDQFAGIMQNFLKEFKAAMNAENNITSLNK